MRTQPAGRTPAPATEVRNARPEEMARTVSTIVAAFLTDPPARFAWPSAHDYLSAMPLATFEKMGQSHPREPHRYLPQMGVEPNAQGKGVGMLRRPH